MKIIILVVICAIIGALFNTAISIANNHKICIVFFYDPLCKECMDAKERLECLKTKYPIDIKEYNILTQEGLDLLFKYYDAFQISGNQRGSFAIFVGEKYYYKISQFDKLEEEIKKHLDTGLGCPKPSYEGNAENIVRGFTIITVIIGGLIDGINPCAFATLVFFIAYIEMARYERKTLLSIGISFSIAVFSGYLLIGIGILEFYYKIGVIGEISEYLYLSIGVLTVILSILNIFDYIRIGKQEKPILQLPNFIKRKRGRMIRILTQRRNIIFLSILSFAIGFGISLLEFVCTGQILIPIMAVIKSASPLKITAFFYLLLYNIMFITPLLLILALFYKGYDSKRLGEMQMKRYKIVKLFTALFLMAIGSYMIYFAMK